MPNPYVLHHDHRRPPPTDAELRIARMAALEWDPERQVYFNVAPNPEPPRGLEQADNIVGMALPDPGQEPEPEMLDHLMPVEPPPEFDPAGLRVSDPGSKLDAGKAPFWRGMFDYFPRALAAVAMVSAAGHDKGYPWGGWRSVPDGVPRYTDAMLRHLAGERDGPYDDGPGGTNCLHAAQVAWNALARLELMLGGAAQ